MNIERFYDAVNQLIRINGELDLQGHLKRVNTDLDNVASNPGDISHQSTLATRLHDLTRATSELHTRLTPEARLVLKDMKAERFFDKAVLDNVKSMVASNNMTPAVALEALTKLNSERNQFLEALNKTMEAFNQLGLHGQTLPPGQTEISVLIPGDLFKNELEALSKELKNLDLMIRPFSEVAKGFRDPVRVDQISSSDPTFFLGLSPETVELIGKAVKGIVEVLTLVLGIKKLRDSSKSVGAPEKMTEMYDEFMKAKVTEAISARALEIVANMHEKDAGRQNELSIMLVKSMNQMTALIERGMKIDIHVNAEPAGDAPAGNVAGTLTRIKALSAEIKYPEIEGEPILQLTASEDAASQSNNGPEAPNRQIEV
jgi:hypothetical protein